MPFTLCLLGPPRLRDENGVEVGYPGKGLLLASHLLLSHDGFSCSRQQASALLWEAADGTHAALNLRQLASRVRARQAELRFDLLVFEGTTVRLDIDGVDIDVAALQRLIAQSDPHRLPQLCELYRGDLLESVEVDGAELRAWVETHRARLRNVFVEEVCGQLGAPCQPLDADLMKRAADAVLAIEPYEERAVRAILTCHAREGRDGLVRHVFNDFAARLRTELNVEPEVETARISALASRPRSGHATAHAAPKLHGGSEPPAPEAQQPWPRIMVVPRSILHPLPRDTAILAALTADVTIDLCAMHTFVPIAPHSAAIASGALADYDYATLFDLDYVVEIQLIEAGGRRELIVYLCRAKSREILVAERFGFDFSTMESQQAQIAASVARIVAAAVERTEISRFARRLAPGAFANYLLAQHQLTVVDLPHVRRARKHFHAALSACSAFAAASSGLARTYHLEWLLLARREAELLDLALKHAQDAVRLDPSDARGHREVGVVHLYGGHFDESLASFSSASSLGPSHADVLADNADALVHAGDVAEGATTIDRAISLNPLCPDDYRWTAGGAYYFLGQYDRSIGHLRQMSDTLPASRLLAASYAMAGDARNARRYVSRALEEHPDFELDTWLSIIPIRDPQRRQHYREGLEAAGFR